MSPSLRSTALAALALCGLALTHAPAMAGEPYKPTRIVQEMRQKFGNGSTDYQMVIGAHRGVYKGIVGCPENSTCSIANTYNKGIEVIELDIKTSANGTPWIFHDRNIGRVTNYGGNAGQYNPFTNAGPNPTIDSLSDTTLTKLRLKDSIATGNSGGTVTGYAPMTLDRALKTIKANYPHMAVLLDVRSAADAAASDRIVRSNGMTGWVAIKGSLSFVRGQNFSSLVVPVVGAGDLDTLAASGAYAPQVNVNNYIDAAFRYSNVIYVEVRMKDRQGPVSGTYAHQATQRGTGSFQPIPDHNGQYYRVNGQCCQTLDETLATTRNFGKETRDDRANDSYHTNFYRTTLTDEPESLASYARSQGRRSNRAYY